MYLPGDIDQFHTLFRQAITALRKQHIEKPDYDVVIRYMELLPIKKAKMLKDPLRRPLAGWQFQDLQAAAKELFSIDKILPFSEH